MATLAQFCGSLPLPIRRTMVLASVPLLISLAWIAIVLPARFAYSSQLEWRDEAATTIARARGSEAQTQALVEQLKALPAATLWNKFYTVSSAGSAGSMLQADVGGILNNVHAGVQSLTPLRAAEVKGLTTIGVRVAASMTIEQLKQFLSAAASHSRFLHIERVRINAPQSQVPDQNVTLTVTLEIYGVERLRVEPPPAEPVPAAQPSSEV